LGGRVDHDTLTKSGSFAVCFVFSFVSFDVSIVLRFAFTSFLPYASFLCTILRHGGDKPYLTHLFSPFPPRSTSSFRPYSFLFTVHHFPIPLNFHFHVFIAQFVLTSSSPSPPSQTIPYHAGHHLAQICVLDACTLLVNQGNSSAGRSTAVQKRGCLPPFYHPLCFSMFRGWHVKLISSQCSTSPSHHTLFTLLLVVLVYHHHTHR